MFEAQAERKSASHLKRLSARIKAQTAAQAWLEQMSSLADESQSRDTEQRCEIQCEALKFSKDKNNCLHPADKQEKHCTQRYSLKTF